MNFLTIFLTFFFTNFDEFFWRIFWQTLLTNLFLPIFWQIISFFRRSCFYKTFILWKSKCMKRNVGRALQKIFQPIIVAYLHHHGLFGCHDCQQKPLHAVHQRDPKQGKIKRSSVMLFWLRQIRFRVVRRSGFLMNFF